jgi:hypothetical protein
MIPLSALLLSTMLSVISVAGEITKKITGEVKIQSQTDDSQKPASPPASILIQDFDLGYDATHQSSGMQGRPVIGRMLPRVSQRNDPEQKARKLVELMSSYLVNGFSSKGIDARRYAQGTPLPGAGWLIRGAFTEIDQGKRVIRATIGFGTGATDMEIHVSVSDLAGNPDAPFISFGTEKEAGRMPGAVVTMNPYAAAAKFVMEKNASEKDVKKTAAQIVDAITNYIETLGRKDEMPSR